MWGGCQWIQKKEQRNMQTLQLKTETKHYVKNDLDGVALSHWASGQKRGMQGSGRSCPRVCCATNPSYLYSSGLRVLWSDVRHINLSLARTCFAKTYLPDTGLHKLWYPGIRDMSTRGKFGAHGEHGDVFLFSNLGTLWFSDIHCMFV